MKFRFLQLFILIFVFDSCKKESSPTADFQTPKPTLPSQLYDYEGIDFPAHFNTSALNAFESDGGNNVITNEGATLGRVLFYDKNLSASRTVSCGSCHEQEFGFANHTAGSRGHLGEFTSRNASHIVNLIYNRRLFWDQRANGLEAQVIMPIENELEMGMTMSQLVERLKTIEYYAPLFDAAFGSTDITDERISLSLAQFVRSIVSYRTKYDVGEELDFANFTSEELLGYQLFYNGETRCNNCHMTANFYTPQAFINGLDVDYADDGVGALSLEADDMGKFKVPSLRNVAVSAPYMHDGRFNTLEDVIEHYNSGVQAHPFLDDRLTDSGTVGGAPRQLNLTQEQKDALVAFLKTLTDDHLLNDPKFGNPFQQ